MIMEPRDEDGMPGNHVNANMESRDEDGMPRRMCHHGLKTMVTPLPRYLESHELAPSWRGLLWKARDDAAQCRSTHTE